MLSTVWWCAKWGGELEHTLKGLVRDLYHHAEYCLAVWLPSSCNAAPLIAKATTQLKEVAFRQHIRRYQILSCYQVSRPGLVNGQWVRGLVRVDREIRQLYLAALFFTIGILNWAAFWKFTPILFCLGYRREKHTLIKVVQSGKVVSHIEILDTC